MNLILLSGGSGKRLWPLSNDVRSKQFLKLLTDENGQRQSMAQRVFAQIKTAQPEAKIVIATGALQMEAIQSQLGDSIEVVLEPERRDTFPAIALASAYLSLKKGMSPDEVVIVLPVDPYTELRYYEMLSDMERAVKESRWDIVLMGIKPESPSPKYGYIVPAAPADADGRYTVARFTEKPTVEAARELIRQGAVWNGGVFAFKLGYLLDTVKQSMAFNTYEELYSRYGELEKISFDYRVVEKAASVGMLLYEGEWKDIGTWTTLTDEIGVNALGNVSMGECENTYAVNELDIPMVVLGAKDIVVAASPDGILVSDISASAGLKPYAEQFDCRPMFEERRWGEYTVMGIAAYGDKTHSLIKHMVIKAGKNTGYQSHRRRDEIWTVTHGKAELVLDGVRSEIKPGDSIHIERGQKYAVRASVDTHLIAVQLGEYLTEDDVECFEWDWNNS